MRRVVGRAFALAAVSLLLLGAFGLTACTGPGLEPPGDDATGGGTGGGADAGGLGGAGGTGGLPTTGDGDGDGDGDADDLDAGYEDDAGGELSP